jgi:GTP-binding protein
LSLPKPFHVGGDNEEAVAFLQKRLVRAGVEQALIEAGARDGDEIRIVERSFEFDTGLEEDPEVPYIEVDSEEEDE